MNQIIRILKLNANAPTVTSLSNIKVKECFYIPGHNVSHEVQYQREIADKDALNADNLYKPPNQHQEEFFLFFFLKKRALLLGNNVLFWVHSRQNTNNHRTKLNYFFKFLSNSKQVLTPTIVINIIIHTYPFYCDKCKFPQQLNKSMFARN